MRIVWVKADSAEEKEARAYSTIQKGEAPSWFMGMPSQFWDINNILTVSEKKLSRNLRLSFREY